MDDTKNRTSPAPASAASPQSPGTGGTPGRHSLSKEERDAIFATAAANMQPARRKPAANQLAEWQPQIMEYYRNGFSPAQIRVLLRAGNVVTSEQSVRLFVRRYSHPKAHAGVTSPTGSAHPKAQGSVTSTTGSPHPKAQSGITSAAGSAQPKMQAGVASPAGSTQSMAKPDVASPTVSVQPKAQPSATSGAATVHRAGG